MTRPTAFLVIDAQGRTLAALPTHGEALDFAYRVSPLAVDLSAPEEALVVACPSKPSLYVPGRLAANPAGGAAGPQRALAASHIPRLRPNDVLSMTLEEAYQEILPVYLEADREVRKFSKFSKTAIRGVAHKMSGLVVPAKGLLSDNTKLAKHRLQRGDTVRTVSLGLALLPESGVFRAKTAGGSERIRGVRPPTGHVGTKTVSHTSTLCNNSSASCRAVCLVFSGQNQSDRRNNFVKFARTKALVTQPAAFTRMLVEALGRFNTACKLHSKPIGNALRFARLNVLSDVPWEEVAPWLFEATDPQADPLHVAASRRYSPRVDLSGLHMYDYTKVPGRTLSPYYDLSFSFSGVNHAECRDELWNAGRRIVIAFASPQYVGASGAQRRKRTPRKVGKKGAWLYWNPLPKKLLFPSITEANTFLPVHDGDTSDIRPLDPHGPLIVGLRFKPPNVKIKGMVGAQKAALAGPFVVNGHYVETEQGPRYAVALAPLSQPTEIEMPGRDSKVAKLNKGIEV